MVYVDATEGDGDGLTLERHNESARAWMTVEPEVVTYGDEEVCCVLSPR